FLQLLLLNSESPSSTMADVAGVRLGARCSSADRVTDCGGVAGDKPEIPADVPREQSADAMTRKSTDKARNRGSNPAGINYLRGGKPMLLSHVGTQCRRDRAHPNDAESNRRFHRTKLTVRSQAARRDHLEQRAPHHMPNSHV